MATATVRRQGELREVDPVVELTEYDVETGSGLMLIDGVQYLMLANRTEGRTIGLRLSRYDERKRCHKVYDIDFTVKPWTCDCDDATYRPERKGGCKHVVALRKAAKSLKGE